MKSSRSMSGKELTAATVTRRLSFHHIGFAVASIAKVGQGFAKSLGAKWDGEIIYDPLQSANVAFLRHDAPQNPAIELVEPVGADSPLRRFLQRGAGLHHVCYEVDSLETQLRLSRESGALIVKPPLPATAFGGRHIAWVYTPEKLLVEYLER